jgi:hypothetical protein
MIRYCRIRLNTKAMLMTMKASTTSPTTMLTGCYIEALALPRTYPGRLLSM